MQAMVHWIKKLSTKARKVAAKVSRARWGVGSQKAQGSTRKNRVAIKATKGSRVACSATWEAR